MRISLFKRLESSVEAFRSTLNRLIVSHEAFLLGMDEGLIPAGEDVSRVLLEADQYEERDLVDLLVKLSDRYKQEDFDIEQLRADIEHDLGILKEMYALVEPITPEDDDKLQTLRHWLFEPADDGSPPRASPPSIQRSDANCGCR